MLLFLSSHRDFDKMLEKFVPAKDLPTIRDAVFTLKTKVCSKPVTNASSRAHIHVHYWLKYWRQYDLFLHVFEKVSSAHQGCIYLIKNTVKH